MFLGYRKHYNVHWIISFDTVLYVTMHFIYVRQEADKDSLICRTEQNKIVICKAQQTM